MPDYRLEFDSPGWLGLLALLPVVALLSYRSLAGLGRLRRWLALALRLAVLSLVIAALAEVQWVRVSDRLTVIYLVDQSLSIPPERRAGLRRYVNEAIARHRQQQDRAGVIVFGREAAVEIPPIDESVPLAEAAEAPLDPEFTNLAAALRLAQASFPEDAAKRVVIVSDGNENLGSALAQAQAVAAAGVGIDVVPVFYRNQAEVAIEKVTVPADVRQGQPFDLRVVVDHRSTTEGESPPQVSGRIVVTQTIDNRPTVISDEAVTLAPGKQVFSLRQQLDQAAPYSYEARFVPDDPAADGLAQNNRATAFTYIRGSGQVLLLEDVDHPGEFDALVEQLRRVKLEVTVRHSDELFTSLPELQQFDTVLLANLPREDLSDDQIAMLVRNTEQFGSGLVMLGGADSFGAGGWTNTELEKALPVDCQIKSAKVSPKGALALLMHASEMAQGNYWQKVIAQEAIRALGGEDYCGVLHWDGSEQWLWNPPRGLTKVGGNRDKMLAKLDRMVPGDMPDFDPTLVMARNSFAQLNDVAVKHMVIISDGDPAAPSAGVVRSLVAGKITVSTVAVGTHGPAGSQELRRLANQTQGKYYEVRNPRALPKIFQREARRVASPLVYEQPPPFSPQAVSDHEMLRGIPTTLPPIKGYVLTSVKENPLVEVVLRAPRPTNPENNVILAGWTYGLGRSVAWTTDAGARWADQWPAWEGFGKLAEQVVRWSMRPVGQPGNFTVSTDVRDGQGQVVITTLDQDDAFQNFLDMQGTVVGPDLKPRELVVEQTAPGRYVGHFNAAEAGSYFVMIQPGAETAPIRTGINVPYSAEFKSLATDVGLLESLAGLEPEGGRPGRLIRVPPTADELQPLEEQLPALLEVDSFRRDLPRATSSQAAWYLVLWAACGLFFADVLVRRVAISWEWLPALVARARLRLAGAGATLATGEYLDRLKSSKAEVSEGLADRQTAARFEPAAPPAGGGPSAVDEALAGAAPPPVSPATPGPGLAPQAEAESYTERLLKAKKQARKDRPQ